MAADELDILQVSTADVAGGAERIALQLHLAYLERGHRATLAVGHRYAQHPGVVELDDGTHRSSWQRALRHGVGKHAGPRGALWLLDRMLRTAASPLHMLDVQRGREDFDFPATDSLLELAPSPHTVLHLHNLHGDYFDLRELPRLSEALPTIATLHDSWLFTGHCAHPIACRRWSTGCGDCPDLDIIPAIRRDATAFNLTRKRDILRESRLHVAAPSQWLLDAANASILADAMVDSRVIPNGVDTAVFRPGDRSAARRQLGIKPDAQVLLFAANAPLVNPFKDFATLRRALQDLRSEPGTEALTLIALGADTPASDALPGVRYVPFISDPSAVAKYYQAADVYVHPALAESFGLSIVEAMACGIPVVASRVGGIPEIVIEGTSGLLFDTRDARALAAALRRVLGDSELRMSMGEAGVRRVAECFRVEQQVDAYLSLYEEVLSKASSA